MPALFENGRTFGAIVERARPGSAIPYHIGFLLVDTPLDKSAEEVALMARHLSNGTMPVGADHTSPEYGMSIGTLAQRKLSEGMYEYVFIKSRRAV
jgi:hypothetical protein